MLIVYLLILVSFGSITSDFTKKKTLVKSKYLTRIIIFLLNKKAI